MKTYEILGFSPMLSDYAPTLHPKFPNREDAERFARQNMRETKFVVAPVGEAGK